MTKRKDIYSLANDTEEERFTKYKQSKKELNQCFLSWAQQQFFAHPDGNWDEGVVQYLRRSKQLAADLLDAPKSNLQDAALSIEGRLVKVGKDHRCMGDHQAGSCRIPNSATSSKCSCQNDKGHPSATSPPFTTVIQIGPNHEAAPSGSSQRKSLTAPQPAAAANGGGLTFGASSSAAPSFSFGSAGFGGTSSSQPGAAQGKKAGAPLFSSSGSSLFGGSSAAAPSSSAGQPAFSGGLGLFGSSSAAPFSQPAAPLSFNFGASGAASSAPSDSKPTLPAFSFPSSTALPSTSGRFGALAEGTAAADGGEAEDDEEGGDGNIKGEVAMDTQSEYLFKDTAKLNVFAPDKPKKWEDRGQGIFTVRRAKKDDAGSKQGDPFAVFTTESGRILVNARLHPGPLPAKEGKKKVQLRFPLFFSKGPEQTAQPHNVLLALSSEAQAESLIAVLKQHMPSSLQ